MPRRPPIATPEDLEARAAELETEGRHLLETAATYRAMAENLRHLVSKGLRAGDSTRTIRERMAHVEAEQRRGAGRPIESDHPFPRAVGNVAAWAEKHGLERTLVRSWYARKPHGRRIPRYWAETIEKETGLPADETTWPNGIRD